MSDTHPPVAEKVLCIDFDGTIVPWQKDELNGAVAPFPRVAAQLRKFKADGWEIVIFTSRLSKRWAKSEVGGNVWLIAGFLDEQYAYIRDLLTKYEVPFDLITAEKVPAQYYVDDKAREVNEHWAPQHTDRVLHDIAIREGVK